MTVNMKRRRDAKRYLRNPVRVFLDGREIFSVWYVDPRRGVLRTYDVRGDGTMATGTCAAKFPIDPTWDAPIDGLLSKELRGKKIELRPK